MSKKKERNIGEDYEQRYQTSKTKLTTTTCLRCEMQDYCIPCKQKRVKTKPKRKTSQQKHKTK